MHHQGHETTEVGDDHFRSTGVKLWVTVQWKDLAVKGISSEKIQQLKDSAVKGFSSGRIQQ